jgi:restriction system protein
MRRQFLPPSEAFDSWTLQALRALEWKRFELLCAKYYEVVGFQFEIIRCGADGGIDVKLFKIDPAKPIEIVQCKAWNTYSVGVKEVRELLGVMAHEKVGRGIFITTSTYTSDALAFGGANPLQLLDGQGFVRKIRDLPQDQQDTLRQFAFEGDCRTPTCASCGIKMTRRESKRGVFWGCLHYPRCKSRFPISV